MKMAVRWGISVLLLLVAVGVAVWFFYSFFHSFFKVGAAIQSGILALIGISASAIMAHWFAKKREIEARHFAEKREGYNSFMDIMFDLLTATKLGRKPPSERELATRLLKYKKMLLIWADAPVIKMWDEIESSLANTDQDPKKVLLMWDRLMREMRKDLGKDDSGLAVGGLVSLILLAEEKHKVKD